MSSGRAPDDRIHHRDDANANDRNGDNSLALTWRPKPVAGWAAAYAELALCKQRPVAGWAAAYAELAPHKQRRGTPRSGLRPPIGD